MSLKSTLLTILKSAIIAGVAGGFVLLVAFLPAQTALPIIAAAGGYLGGIGLFLFVVYRVGLPGMLGETIGNMFLEMVARATGGNLIEEERDGNFEMRDFDDSMPPEKNRYTVHQNGFGVTFECAEGCFGDAAIDGTVPGTKVEDSTPKKMVTDGGETYYYKDDVGDSHVVPVKWRILTQRMRNLGTTQMAEERERSATDEHGGDTSQTGWKGMLVGVALMFVLGFAAGYLMFM